jgi:hypothetical protein
MDYFCKSCTEVPKHKYYRRCLNYVVRCGCFVTLHRWSDVGPELGLGLGLQRVQMGHNLSQGASICDVLQLIFIGALKQND